MNAIQETKFWNDEMTKDPSFLALIPDNWNDCGAGYRIEAGDQVDIDFFGVNTLRVHTEQPVIETLPVKIYPYSDKITYTAYFHTPRIRVHIEFMKDGEPSVWHKGYLYLYTGHKG